MDEPIEDMSLVASVNVLPFSLLFSLKAVKCFLLTSCLQEIKLMKYMIVFYLDEN